jgi:hypothetical protein
MQKARLASKIVDTAALDAQILGCADTTGVLLELATVSRHGVWTPTRKERPDG